MMSAMMLSGAIYAVLALNFKVIVFHYIASVLVFVIVFISFRKYIFRERYLEIVFDKTKEIATLRRSRFIGMRTEKIPFSSIKSVEAGSRQILPVNIDGIQFVQKISAQHGSPVPGLEEVLREVLPPPDAPEQIDVEADVLAVLAEMEEDDKRASEQQWRQGDLRFDSESEADEADAGAQSLEEDG